MGLSPWTTGRRHRQWGYRHRQSVVARGNRGNVASDRDDVAGKYGSVIGKRAEAYKLSARWSTHSWFVETLRNMGQKGKRPDAWSVDRRDTRAYHSELRVLRADADAP